MAVALQHAANAAAAGEVPVGALVVRDDTILGVGSNAPIGSADPTAHAEILALRRAALHVGNYRLPGSTLYVTVEPCLMCLGALLHARVERLVYGCREPKSGALGGAYVITPPPALLINAGVCADQAVQLLQAFFKARRGA